MGCAVSGPAADEAPALPVPSVSPGRAPQMVLGAQPRWVAPESAEGSRNAVGLPATKLDEEHPADAAVTETESPSVVVDRKPLDAESTVAHRKDSGAGDDKPPNSRSARGAKQTASQQPARLAAAVAERPAAEEDAEDARKASARASQKPTGSELMESSDVELADRATCCIISCGEHAGDKWSGITAVGNVLYCGPSDLWDPTSGLLVVDTRTESCRVIKCAEKLSSFRWSGITAVGDVLYCAPCHASEVLVVDTRTEICRTIDCGLEGEWKWSGITAVGDVLYCAPAHASGVLVVDTQNESCRMIDCGVQGQFKWNGITAVGDVLYCAPCHASGVLVVDTRTEICRTIDCGVEDDLKWTGITAVGDVLYCAPCHASGVLVVDTKTEICRTIDCGVEGSFKWYGITSVGDVLYCAPCHASGVLVVDTKTEICRIIDCGVEGSQQSASAANGKWNGITAANGMLYCAPSGASGVLVYSDDHTRNLTAMHSLCLDRVTPKALEYTVKMNPLWPATGDASGCLPLHFLCQNTALEPQWITWLLKLNADAASWKDNLGRLPLHYLCDNSAISLEALSLMLEADQGAAGEADGKCAKLPLHALCGNSGSTFEMLQLLFDAYPMASTLPDGSSRLPLDYLEMGMASFLENVSQVSSLPFKEECISQYINQQHSHNANVSNIDCHQEGGYKWCDAAMVGDVLYCAPAHASGVLVVDTKTQNCHMIDCGVQGQFKWYGITAVDNTLYCAPSCASGVLVVDTQTESCCTIDCGVEGDFKWFGITAVGDVLYCAPGHASGVLVVDTKTEICRTIDCGFTGEFKWIGITAVGDVLYCAPAHASGVLVVDTQTESCRTIECGFKGEFKWFGITAVGDVLYCAPCHASGVLVVDTKTEICRTIDCGVEGEFKWYGITAVGDVLYCAPSRASGVLVVDTKTEICHIIDCGVEGDIKYFGITAANGMLYCAPFSASEILVYSDDHTRNLTAMHSLCLDRVTPQALEYTVKMNPLWPATGDASGCLPLHFLCRNTALEPQWITWLLKLNADAASWKDNLGRLPLHYLCDNSAISLEALSLMLEADQGAAGEADGKCAKLPLHALCGNSGSTFEMLQLLFDAYPMASTLPDGSSRLPLDYLETSTTITPHSAAQLCAGDFKQHCIQHYARSGDCDFCIALVESGACVDTGWAHDPRSPRSIGLSALQCDIRDYFLRVKMLLGRFQLDPEPRHKSATCLAVAGTNVHSQEPVMLKFMEDKLAFVREIEKRQQLGDGKDEQGRCCIVSILEHHELEPEQVSLAGMGAEFKYLIVMPLGSGDLSDEIRHAFPFIEFVYSLTVMRADSHGNFAGIDKPRALSAATHIARALEWLNERGCEAQKCGEVQLSLSLHSRALIDLDASALINGNELAGQKRTSSGCWPPELAAAIIEEQAGGAKAAVLASKAQDMWQLCTGYTLFATDNQENVAADDLETIASWNDHEKASKLEKIGKGWPRRLIGALLSKDPSQRPRSWSYVIKQLGGAGLESAININACSVHHLCSVLLPACDKAIESRLEDSGNSPAREVHLESAADGSIWHMVNCKSSAATFS